MGIVPTLSLLALRGVATGARAGNGDAGDVVALLSSRFTQGGERLATALRQASDRAWLALELALVGEAAWDRWQGALEGDANQPVREGLRHYLDALPASPFVELSPSAREECARKLQHARQAGLLAAGGVDLAELARRCSVWVESDDGDEPADVEAQLMQQLAVALRQTSQAHLARILELQAADANLLAHAARVFLSRELRQNEELAAAFPWIQSAAESEDQGLLLLADLLDRHGKQIDDLLARPLPRVTLDAGPATDLEKEAQRHGPAVQQLARDILHMLQRFGLERLPLGPLDCLAMQTSEDRQRAQQISAKAAEMQQQHPAMLHALGKLKALAGAFDAAQRDLQLAANLTSEPAAQADVYASLFQVALERKQAAEALTAFTQSATLDPGRFARFPISKYEPTALLRVDGPTITFLCRHRSSNSQVTVETLRPELLERPIAELFHEAQVLDALERPAIHRLRDCDFADRQQTRPFLVCDYFEGLTLAEHVEQHGPLSTDDLLAIARPVIEALEAAHSRGILHRNLTPHSLLLRKEATGWRVKIIGFGMELSRHIVRAVAGNLAMLGRTNLGTSVLRRLEFAAPEQLGRLPGAAVGSQTDVCSFARVAYFALLRTCEPDDEEKEALSPVWRRLLGHCTSITLARRLSSFTGMVERLARPQPAALTKPTAEPAAADSVLAAACVQRGINHRLKGDFDEALAEFNRAIQLDARNPLAFQGRGNTYSSRGDYEEAIADYTAALKLDPKGAQTLVNRGLAYIKRRDTNRAIADYTAAIQIDPNLSLGYLNRGSAYARMGDYDRAIIDYSGALEIDSKLPLALYNRGLAYAKKENHQAAIADYRKALELVPTNAEIQARLQYSLKALAQQPAQPVQRVPPSRQGVPPVQAVSPSRQGVPPVQAVSPSRQGVPSVQAVSPSRHGLPDALSRRPLPPDMPEEAADSAELFALESHTDAVRCVAFSPDGRRLLSASEDKSVRLWDVKTGRRLSRLTGHTGAVLTAAFTPGGSHIVTGSQDHSVRLWEIDTGEEIIHFGRTGFFGGSEHSDAVVSVSISPDGKRVLSASWDKTVRLWEIESGKELQCFEGHNWLIHSVAFSPDGSHFLYGSEDQTLRLCLVESGREVRRFTGHNSWVLSVAFSPDGRYILSGSSDGTTRLWNTKGKELRQFGGQMGLVQCVAFSPEGKRALSGEYTLPGENTLMRLWNLETGQELARFTGHKQLIWSVAMSPDGRHAASGSADHTARIWRLPRS